jgi:hypothetical protein
VGTEGKVLGSKVAYEDPPGVGFGSEVAGWVLDALFIPGFRDGKCVRASSVRLSRREFRNVMTSATRSTVGRDSARRNRFVRLSLEFARYFFACCSVFVVSSKR